jgi:hypothetical protein
MDAEFNSPTARNQRLIAKKRRWLLQSFNLPDTLGKTTIGGDSAESRISGFGRGKGAI